MIILNGKSPDGKNCLAIGICDGHMAMLKEEGGMRVVTPDGLIIDIVYAATEADLIAQLKLAGLITDKTEVVVEKSKTPASNIVKMDNRIITPPDNASNN